MAYRQIHTHIWKDEWFLDLEPAEKLLFVYLFSNDNTTLAGIYKISLKVIAFETGLELPFIKKTLEKFNKAGKAVYQDGIIWVVNLMRYNASSNSPKVQICIVKELQQIPDCELKTRYLTGNIGYQYPIDTLSLINNNNNNSINASEKPSDARKREVSPDDQAFYELQKHFLILTGLPKPSPKTQADWKEYNTLWKSPGKSILEWLEYDMNKAKIIIDDTVKAMQKDGLTICNFKSISKVASSELSKRTNGNGTH